MIGSIGKQLGVLLANFESDLHKDVDDMEALQKITMISEAYRNFANAGLAGFQQDFADGYQVGVSDLRILEGGEPDKAGQPQTTAPSTENDGGPALG